MKRRDRPLIFITEGNNFVAHLIDINYPPSFSGLLFVVGRCFLAFFAFSRLDVQSGVMTCREVDIVCVSVSVCVFVVYWGYFRWKRFVAIMSERVGG